MPAMNRSLILAVIVIAVLIAAIFSFSAHASELRRAHAFARNYGLCRCLIHQSLSEYHFLRSTHRLGIRYYPEIGYAYGRP